MSKFLPQRGKKLGGGEDFFIFFYFIYLLKVNTNTFIKEAYISLAVYIQIPHWNTESHQYMR